MSVAISDAGGDYGAVIVSGANLLVDPASLDRARRLAGRACTDPAERDARSGQLCGRPCGEDGRGDRLSQRSARIVPCRQSSHRSSTCSSSTPIEAEQLGGIPVDDLASAAAAAEALGAHYPAVVVTAGGDGVAGVLRGEEPVVLAALPVKLVSTHGAGDVFVGSLVAALAAGLSFGECLRAANAAAAVHVSAAAIAA